MLWSLPRGYLLAQKNGAPKCAVIRTGNPKIENPKWKIHSGDSAVAEVIVEIEQIGE
jgi:hypothetical protein